MASNHQKESQIKEEIKSTNDKTEKIKPDITENIKNDNNKIHDNNDSVNFGFQKVSPEKKRNLVEDVFSDIASRYDIMNDLMSLGTHRLWKDEFVSMIPDLNSKILDVAGGTGDISFRIKERAKRQNKNPDITVCDINQDMLKICRDRAVDKNYLDNFNIILGDAQKLPFKDNIFDYYTISFGIRNVVSINRALEDAYRVLKPGGKFLCLEFSKVQNEIMKPLYDFYSFNLIPRIGKMVTSNEGAYRYLAESISIFPDQEDFKTAMQEVGFENVGYKNLTFGVAAIHYGYKI